MKPKHLIAKAATAEASAEILIHGPIGKSFWDSDGVSAKDFTDELNKIPKGTKVTVGINSQGGVIGEGLAMYNAIKRRSADVTVRIDGYALSAASFLGLAASRVITPKTAIWMIHKGWSYAQGNADEMHKQGDLLETHDRTMAAAYVDKTKGTTKKSEADWLEAMAEETWLSGEEAIAWGLADEEGVNAVALDALDFSAMDAKTFKKPSALQGAILGASPYPASQLGSMISLYNALAAAGNTHKTPEQTPAATASTSAPIAGATNQPQQGPKMRDTYTALLNKWGVQFEASATDAQLEALVTAGKPQPASTDPINAELARIRAELDGQRRYGVELAIDRLILENKVTNAERNAEIALCLADNSRLSTVLAKRTANLPGASPITGIVAYGDEGPRDAVMKVKGGRTRFDYMRDNWGDLLAAGYRKPGVQAANTTDAQLVTDMLTEGATTVLQNRLAPLRAFSKEVSIDRLKPMSILQHRKVTAGGTAQVNATSFEDTTNFVGAETNIPITIAQITSGGHITNLERQNGVTMAQWVEVKTAEIGDKIMAAVGAVILEGTFTITPVVSSAIGFGSAELAELWGKLKKSPIHNIILDGEYYAQFLPTDRFGFEVTEYRNRGWDNFLLNTVWTGATANTVGFACNPQAIVVGTGLPLRSQRANNVSTESILQLPGLGISVAIYDWYSNITRNDWTTYDVMFGAAANDSTAGVLIKSA